MLAALILCLGPLRLLVVEWVVQALLVVLLVAQVVVVAVI
jgi:hypothetical protein